LILNGVTPFNNMDAMNAMSLLNSMNTINPSNPSNPITYLACDSDPGIVAERKKGFWACPCRKMSKEKI